MMYLRLKRPCFRKIGSTWLSYVSDATYVIPPIPAFISSLKELHLTCMKYTFVMSTLNVSKQRQKLGNSSENVQYEISQCKIKQTFRISTCFPYLSFHREKGCHRSKLLSEFRNFKI